MERRQWSLIAVCSATFMLLLDVTIVNVALPSIRDDLGASFEDLQWVVDAYALTLAAFVLTAGSLADRLGRKRVFLAGLVVFTVASAGCALAASPLMLNLARAVQGVGGAVMFAVSLAILAQEFHGRERGKATAIYGATIGVAVATGPLVGGALTDGLGWEWIFWINVPVGIAAIALTLAHVIESRDPLARGVDWVGLVTFSLANGLLVYALLRANAEGWTSTLVLGCLSTAAVLLAVFVLAQARVAQPMLPLGYFRNRSFTAAQIGAFAISGSMFALFLYLTLYVQNVIGHSALEAGLIYLPSTVVTFVVSGLTANMMSRVPLRALLAGGLALTGIGLLAMTGRSEGDEWTALLPGFLVAGVGVGLTNPVIANIALSTVPDEQSGVASGINDTFRQVGVATGVAALGALLLSRAGDHIQSALGIAHEQAGLLAEGVSSGALPAGVPAPVVAVARQGFLEGLNLVVVLGAALALAGALATALLVRESDLVGHGLLGAEDEPAGGAPAAAAEIDGSPLAFVLAPRTPRDGGRARPTPIATAFLVCTRGAQPAPGAATFAVTARHVVAHEPATFVQLGEAGAVRVARWVSSATADVAVAALPGEATAQPAAIDLDAAAVKRGGRGAASAGLPVLLESLLADVPELAGRRVPTTRAGTIAALDVGDVPVAGRDGEIAHVSAHLIDCPSFAGIGGAPCFVRAGRRKLLLGVMSGHFDKWTKLKGSGDFRADFVGTADTPVNSSIGVCTPVAAIRELLAEPAAQQALAEARRDGAHGATGPFGLS